MYRIEKTKISEVYKMTSKPRGYCIIINIINFTGNKFEERNDSVDNVCMIKSAFENLHFSVITYYDLEYKDIFSYLNELTKKQECDNHDAFVLYIGSHGEEEGFIASNNKVISYNEIIDVFSDIKCKKFIKKPKLILFDCCRGGY